MKCLYFLIFSTGYLANLSAQIESIVFQSPSSKYHDIVLHSYLGDPILYRNSIDPNQLQFQLLTEMKWMKEDYDNMPLDYPLAGIKKPKTTDGPHVNLIQVLSTSMNSEGKNMFFCSKADCFNQNTKKRSRILSADYWAGSMADEFESTYAFKKYVNEELDDLRQWSNSLPLDLYICQKTTIGEYDFELQGFSLNLSLDNVTTSLFYNPNSLNLQHDIPASAYRNEFNAFLSMSPEQAKKLLQDLKNNRSGRRTLYLLYKGKINSARPASKLRPNNNGYRFLGFSLRSNVVEVFTDETFGNKLATLELNLR